MDERIKVWTGYVRRSQLGPQGLCAQRDEHPGHLHESPSLGRFWCTANESEREPGRSQRRLDEQERAAWRCAIHGPGQPCNSMCGPVLNARLTERERAMLSLPITPLGPGLPKDMARLRSLPGDHSAPLGNPRRGPAV